MSEQSEALRLADTLEKMPLDECDHEAAAELRRLHALNAELVEALREIEWSNDTEWQRDRARAALEKKGNRPRRSILAVRAGGLQAARRESGSGIAGESKR